MGAKLQRKEQSCEQEVGKELGWGWGSAHKDRLWQVATIEVKRLGVQKV